MSGITEVRDHFVYRIYDDSDLLLYIGCTNRPRTRWAEHRAERPGMACLAARFHMAGPYPRVVARQLEREAAESEHPRFGLTPSRQNAIMQAYSWEVRRVRELTEGGWDYLTAWKLAAVEVRTQFPGAPTSYSDVTRPMQAVRA